MSIINQYIKEIEHNIKQKDKIKVTTEEVGQVVEVRDGVISLSGLNEVGFGEILKLESGPEAYVIDLTEDAVNAIVLGEYTGIKSGEIARATGKTLSIDASDDYLGRVVNPLGSAIDGKGTVKTGKRYDLEKPALGVVFRQSVTQPLQTGILAIDALVPIGRGQRELIIGDRGVGKTTLAIDAIINQKGQDVVCIYCAIGQKTSKIAQIVELLKKTNSLDYTIIVSASASEPASLQFLAPYSATALAEYFREKGKDVLIVYDDLSKHAWAYRQVSLILRRPAGREAYPGDVFYLHSRLLERACRISEKYGGGSITALPIIETLAGDLSTYIPTNVISITDGQIFLETDLFNSGIRPAINAGLSVSRVGGNAQTKGMKKVSGRLKLDLAQYREMAAFSQFESELDAETKKLLTRGAKTTQILKQRQHHTYDLATQIALIWSATNGQLDNLSNKQIEKFVTLILEKLSTSAKSWVDEINKSKVMDEKQEAALKELVMRTVESIESQ